MLIQRDTASSLLKQSMVIVGVDGKLKKNVKSVLTDTLEMTLDDLSIVYGGEIQFVVSSTEERDQLAEELEGDVLPDFIVIDPTGPAKKAMDETDTAEFLSVIYPVSPSVCQCSNCNTYFLVHLDAHQNVWTMDKAKQADTFFTMTKVEGALTCDSCSASVTILRP